MKSILKTFPLCTLALLGIGTFALIGLTGCATTEDSNPGKIGPDYDDPLSNQIRMQEAQSRVTRSMIR